MRKLITPAIIISLFFLFPETDLYSQYKTLSLWSEGKVPHYKDTGLKEEISTSGGVTRISHVQKPEMTVFLPSGSVATGQAVVICPGGGYHILAWDKEGTDIAKWLNSLGIAGVVLKYRLPVDESNTISYKVALEDAQRALRLVRFHAKKWNIDPQKVGIMGFSAGGHLASTAATHFDKGDPQATDPVEKLSCRPDFVLLGYAVVSLADTITHHGTKQALLRSDPSSERMKEFSNERQVTADTPPVFLFLAADDKTVPPENSLYFFMALKDHKVSAELHIYPGGGHGFGLAIDRDEHTARWTQDAAAWLKWIDER